MRDKQRPPSPSHHFLLPAKVLPQCQHRNAKVSRPIPKHTEKKSIDMGHHTVSTVETSTDHTAKVYRSNTVTFSWPQIGCFSRTYKINHLYTVYILHNHIFIILTVNDFVFSSTGDASHSLPRAPLPTYRLNHV